MNDKQQEYISMYSNYLTRFCISLCGNIDDAEDLFQETWCKAIKAFSKYDKDKPFDKWLLSICANIYKDNVKLSYNKKKVHFETEEQKQSFFESIPDVEQSQKNEFCELHNAISNLPKKQKLVLSLYYFKDFSVNEISKILKIPEGTVKSRLNSARKTIKRSLEDER